MKIRHILLASAFALLFSLHPAAAFAEDTVSATASDTQSALPVNNTITAAVNDKPRASQQAPTPPGAPAAAPAAEDQAEATKSAPAEKPKAVEQPVVPVVNIIAEPTQEEKDAYAQKTLNDVITAFSSGSFDIVMDKTPAVMELRPELAEKLSPLLAYAYHKKGYKDRALDSLKGNDLYANLLKAVINGKTIVPDGSRDEVKGAAVYVVDIGVPSTNGDVEGIAYNKALKKAMKEALVSITKEPGKHALETFDEKIMPEARKYYLGHYTLAQDESGGNYSFQIAMFLDEARLKGALANLNITGNGAEHSLKAVLINKKGGEAIKKTLLKDLMNAGFIVEDIGSGDISPEYSSKLKGTLVIQISEEGYMNGKLMNSNFKIIRGNLVFTILNGNNGLVIGKIEKAETVTSLSEDSGREAAVQKAYEKALKPLKDGLASIEARMGKEIASGLLPSIEASFTDAKEVFSNIYKSYSNDPIGKVVVKNNTNNAYEGVKLGFMIKDYMDYPVETMIDRLGPKESKSVPVKPVFSNKLLDLTDNTLVQSEVTVRYTDAGAEKTVKLRQPVQVYEKQALVWDDKGKVVSFMTYKDPVVVSFATKAVREYNYPNLNLSIVMARAIFAGMGVVGIKYVPDPTPYATVANVTSIVDRVQYPRQTLARKAGDCDDLVSLFGASLESVGVKVMPIEAPAHIFIMFDTGISASDIKEAGFRADMFIEHEGRLWVPFETTLVGQPFYLAWEKGVENYKKWKAKVNFIDPRKSWLSYAPATLPNDEFRQSLSMASIEKKFPGELDNLRRIKVEQSMQSLSKKSLSLAEKKETIMNYGKNGMTENAIRLSEELLKSIKDDAELLNNAGNLYFLKSDFEKALSLYESALKQSPDDAGILVNIARVRLKLNQRDKAAAAFKKATTLDPSVTEDYLKLHTEIGM